MPKNIEEKNNWGHLLVAAVAFALVFPAAQSITTLLQPNESVGNALQAVSPEPIVKEVIVEVPVEEEKFYPGRLLVKFKEGTTEKGRSEQMKKWGIEKEREIKGPNVAVMKVPPQAEEALARALSKHPMVEFAEVDMIAEPALAPNDPSFGNQWAHNNIGSQAAWDLHSDTSNVTIAIADSGVNMNHADLAANIVSPWDVVSNDSDATDTRGHGTAVAGVAAAIGNNGVGIAGVAYQANIMPIQITERSTNGSAYTSDIVAAITYAADNGADVINISYRACNSGSVASAGAYMKSKGGLVVLSAGNDNNNLGGISDSPNLICVSAVTSSETKASWSNFGDYIDMTAPGSGILTTNKAGGYNTWSGTSFSAPMVAGSLALIKSANPGLTPDQIESILESTARDIGDAGWDQLYGWGIPDLEAAVAAAQNVTTPPIDNIDPDVTITLPTNGSTIGGQVTVAVDASDNVAVDRVELRKAGQLIGTDSNSPYTFYLNTLSEDNGPIALEARAVDSSNNVATDQISVTVENVADTVLPTVSISQPADGEVWPTRGSASISVNASDNVGVSSIQILLDGSVRNTCTNVTTCSTSVNLKKIADGDHTIEARATDAAGNTANTQITVTRGGGGDDGGGGGGNGNPGKGKKK